MCGYRKFYVELIDAYSPEDVNTFVYDYLLPFLDAPYDPKMEKGFACTRVTNEQARALLIAWLAQFKDEQATIVTDTHYYDLIQMQKLLGKEWPGYINKTPWFVENTYFSCFGSHHALDDAINMLDHRIKQILLSDALKDAMQTLKGSYENTCTEYLHNEFFEYLSTDKSLEVSPMPLLRHIPTRRFNCVLFT